MLPSLQARKERAFLRCSPCKNNGKVKRAKKSKAIPVTGLGGL
jgi:hypothetical protein